MASLVLLLSAILHPEDANSLAADRRLLMQKRSSWSDQKGVFTKNGADAGKKPARNAKRDDADTVEDPVLDGAKFCIEFI